MVPTLSEMIYSAIQTRQEKVPTRKFLAECAQESNLPRSMDLGRAQAFGSVRQLWEECYVWNGGINRESVRFLGSAVALGNCHAYNALLSIATKPTISCIKAMDVRKKRSEVKH